MSRCGTTRKYYARWRRVGSEEPSLTAEFRCLRLSPAPIEEIGAKVDYQVAAPVELRTPNLHRANNRSTKSADGRMATEAARLERKEPRKEEENRIDTN